MNVYATTILISLCGVLIATLGAYLGAKHGSISNSRKRNSRKYTHAALDKRLEVHQMAFSLSLQLPSAAEEITEKELNEKWHKITHCTYDVVNAIGFRWLGDMEPMTKEGNYQRRSSDWQHKRNDRRRGA
jgi:hypothetical protein